MSDITKAKLLISYLKVATTMQMEVYVWVLFEIIN